VVCFKHTHSNAPENQVPQWEVRRFGVLCFNQSKPLIDPIWFGVIIVMTVELGLIHPPVGMNVFVIKSVVQDVSFSTIFKGVLPFIVTDLIRLVILIAFPILALWLPSHM
jgi:TRAP-type C4-dicarboxylate transport system permease large subunit